MTRTKNVPGNRRVILVHRYYWPDTPPYAAMLHQIALHLAKTGFQVSVITAQPSYGDSTSHSAAPRVQDVEGVLIRRLGLLPERKDQRVRRAINLMLFTLQVFVLILIGPKPDAVMAGTTPPIVVARAASLAARFRRAEFIYHNQDIYPEVLGPPRNWTAKQVATFLRDFDRKTGTNASKVVVLSSDMATTWSERGLDGSKLAIINNFDTFEGALPTVPPVADGMRRVVFAGNVGRFQDVAGLVAAVASDDLNSVELVIVGDGVALQECKRIAGPGCHFAGRTDRSEAAAWIATADAAVVTLQPDLYKYVYPSKTFTYLAAGAPIFARVESQSELAKLIVDERIGWVTPPGDKEALMAALQNVQSLDADELAAMRSRVADVARRTSMEIALNKWTELFRPLTVGGSL